MPREAKEATQGYPAGQGQGWDPTPGLCSVGSEGTPGPCPDLSVQDEALTAGSAQPDGTLGDEVRGLNKCSVGPGADSQPQGGLLLRGHQEDEWGGA